MHCILCICILCIVLCIVLLKLVTDQLTNWPTLSGIELLSQLKILGRQKENVSQRRHTILQNHTEGRMRKRTDKVGVTYMALLMKGEIYENNFGFFMEANFGVSVILLFQNLKKWWALVNDWPLLDNQIYYYYIKNRSADDSYWQTNENINLIKWSTMYSLKIYISSTLLEMTVHPLSS